MNLEDLATAQTIPEKLAVLQTYETMRRQYDTKKPPPKEVQKEVTP